MAFEYKKHDLYPDSILIRNFVGSVGVKDIIESWEFLVQSKLITKSIKGVIHNLSDSTLTLDLSSFSTVLNFLKKQISLKGIKFAIICDTPQKIVFPTLAELEVSELQIKPFSTVQAAVDWIMFEK